MTKLISSFPMIVLGSFLSCCLFASIATPVQGAQSELAQADFAVEDVEFDVDPNNEMTPEQREVAEQVAKTTAAIMPIVMAVMFILFIVEIVLLIMNFLAASSIPAEHQQVAPWMVFLLLVPCVNIVMVFIVFPGIARGFQSYFSAQGGTDVGDCGSGLAIGTAICLILLGPIGLILWVILSLKFNGYKKELEAGSTVA